MGWLRMGMGCVFVRTVVSRLIGREGGGKGGCFCRVCFGI